MLWSSVLQYYYAAAVVYEPVMVVYVLCNMMLLPLIGELCNINCITEVVNACVSGVESQALDCSNTTVCVLYLYVLTSQNCCLRVHCIHKQCSHKS